MVKPWATTSGDKNVCRRKFISAIEQHISDPKDFFVLPSKDAIDVKLLKGKWARSRIRGVECDKHTFGHIQDNHFDCFVERMTVKRLIEREDDHPSGTKFDAVFLDYTGICTPKNVIDVVGFVHHLTQPKCILGVTFQKSPRGKEEETGEFVFDHSWVEDEDLTIHDDADLEWNTSLHIADAVAGAIENGYTYTDKLTSKVTSYPALRSQLRRLEILDHRTYRAGEKTMPMHFAVLLIERN